MSHLYIYIIPIVLYCISGICDAVIDTLQFHFSTSIFSGKNDKYWNPRVSWTNKYIDNDQRKGLKYYYSNSVFQINVPIILSDAFHLFKFLREFFNVAAIIVAAFIGFNYGVLYLCMYFVMLGELRNQAFNLFFNHILIK